MKKMSFIPLLIGGLLLTSIQVSPQEITYSEVKGLELTYKEVVQHQPGTIGDHNYSVVKAIHMEASDLGYADIADSSTSSITYQFGVDNGGIGNAFYLETPGGGFDTLLRIQTTFSDDLSTSTGLLMFVNASEIKAEEGDKINVGLGLVFMDSPVEPPHSSGHFDPSVYKGHFRHFYVAEGRDAFYYDLTTGGYVATTIVNKCVVLSEGFEGWIYLPFTSFTWNARTGDANYEFQKAAFDSGYNWLNYSHFILRNAKSDDTQSRIYFDELNFVSEDASVVRDYSSYATVNATCDNIGFDVYKDSVSDDYKIVNVTPALGHDYTYYTYPGLAGAVGVCSYCGDYIYKADEHPSTPYSGSPLVDVHFHYGKNYEKEEIVFVESNESIARDKEPHIYCVTMDDDWDYDFSVWSKRDDFYDPQDPKATNHTGTTHYYAKYLISSYDNVKYSHVPNLLAMHGGRYGSTKGKIVMNGNSNFALAYNTTSDFANRGLPLINNAVAGGSSYDYIYYSDQLVIGFAPKILLFNLTTNDQAYWCMSEKNVIKTIKQFIDRVHTLLPDCQIAVVNASPLPGRSEMFKTVERVNNHVKKYAETLDYVHYIDTYQFVYQRMLEYPDGWEFWTHMETDTLSTWLNLIADGVQEIVDEKGIIF